MNRIVAISKEEAIKALAQLKPSVVAFDTETTDLSWYKQEVHGVSICDGETTIYIDITDENIFPLLSTFFEQTVLLIAHNITFDVKALYKHGVNLFEKQWFDTMVAEHLIDERNEKSLKKMAEKYLGATTATYEQTVKMGIHSEKFYEYALNDAQWTWEIFHQQKGQLHDCGVVELMRDIEMPFLKALAEMEMNGITVDVDRVEEKTAELKELVFSAEIKVLEAAGHKPSIQMGLDGSRSVKSTFDVNSPKHLRELLYDKLGLKAPGKTNSGMASTDKTSLASLKNEHDIVPLILEYRKYKKLLSSFFEPLMGFVDGDGKVRPSFNNVGTRTGRLSCSKPNLQQLPQGESDPAKTRSCFTSQAGYTMITCDYSGQEIRVLAHVSQDEALIDILHKGQDLHLATAKRFYNIDVPDEALKADHPKHEEYKELYKKQRNQAKIINFGIAYGKGAFGFAQDFKITEEEAQAILDEYFNGFPGVYNAIQQAKRDVKRNGYVTSMTGRRRHFDAKENNGDKYYANASFREAFNFLIQGYSADMIRMATIKVRETSKEHPEWDLRMLATVHDENVYEVKNQYLEEAKNAIKQSFERAVSLAVPVVSKIGVGPTYNEAK